MSDFFDELLNKPVHFLDENAPGAPVVISSRIRVARNIKNFPFPTAADPEQGTAIRKLVRQAIARSGALPGGCWNPDVAALSNVEKAILLERHLASRELLNGSLAPDLYIAKDRTCSVMVNE